MTHPAIHRYNIARARDENARLDWQRTQQAHRGYLIMRLLTGGFSVSRDGSHICYAESVEAARATIDALLD